MKNQVILKQTPIKVQMLFLLILVSVSSITLSAKGNESAYFNVSSIAENQLDLCHLNEIALSVADSTIDLAEFKNRFDIRLQYSDGFNKNLTNWVSEIQSGGTIAIVAGKLDIKSIGGSTVWFDHKLSQPVVITYNVTTLADGVDGLPRDHNLFWMALNPKNPTVRPSGSGDLGDYDCYNLYYAGIGGNKNKTTRFRRYDNCERTLIYESGDKTHLNTANQTYHIKIVCIDKQVKVYRDGQIYLDFKDENPYKEGWFGFRQTRTHLQIDNFKVYALKEKGRQKG